MLKSSTLLALIGCILSSPVSATEESRPNILFILADDLGWRDTSVPFADHRTPLNKRYHTPNMQRLAREGIDGLSASDLRFE